MSKIIWTPNGKGVLAHVGISRHYGVYLGYVSNYDDGKGWRYEFMVDGPFGDRVRFVSTRGIGMGAIRRRWDRFLEQAELVHLPVDADAPMGDDEFLAIIQISAEYAETLPVVGPTWRLCVWTRQSARGVVDRMKRLEERGLVRQAGRRRRGAEAVWEMVT